MDVTKAAAAAFGEGDFLARFGEVGEQCLAVFIVNLRADGNEQVFVLGGFAVALFAHAVTALVTFEMLLEAVIDEGVEAGDRAHDDAGAAAAIAAIRATLGDEFLTTEGDTAFAAIA